MMTMPSKIVIMMIKTKMIMWMGSGWAGYFNCIYLGNNNVDGDENDCNDEKDIKKDDHVDGQWLGWVLGS